MRHRLAHLLAVASIAGGVAAIPAASPPVALAKTCSSGYKHAVIGGSQKCLRVGEFCARRYQRQYKRYGYTCNKFDGARWHLRRR